MPKTINSLSRLTSVSPEYKLTYGGWYQRTTLHLSELYEFFKNADSYLDLDKQKIKAFHDALGINSVTRQLGYLEYVEVKTDFDIVIRYYEDGLYILTQRAKDVEASKAVLESFFEEKLNPAINYLFSLGAPTPKILANIKVRHPVVVTLEYEQDEEADFMQTKWLHNVYNTIEFPGVKVTKAQDYIFIQIEKQQAIFGQDLIDMQIFFREFKDQLERYLNMHRKIWEAIAKIKEKKDIRTKELGDVRNRLDMYQKTVSLISNRINQMGSYARTRKSIAQQTGVDTHLVNLFQYRFEVLLDTLEYIKEIWKMTTDYVINAIQVVVEAQSAATARSIQSLTLITSIGVIAGMITHLSRESFPKVTYIGLVYFVGLLFVGWLLNYVIQQVAKNKKQTLKFKEIDKNI